MAAPLFRRHDAAGQVRYQEVKQLAVSQTRVLTGTPGTLKRRTRAGNEYWVREHTRADGRKVDEYLGAQSALEPSRIDAARAEIELANALAAGSSTLRLFGYQRVDRKPAAALAALFNRELFGAGLVLVGSHAYGVLLNELGISAAGYRTQDIDVARATRLAVALPEGLDLRALLGESGLPFVPVPGMPSHRPSTSFKLPGAGALALDLLVPGAQLGEVLPVAELAAHGQAIPLLDFLVAKPINAVVLSPNQVIPVQVPSPERFLLHKLFSSQSRRTGHDKIRKDLAQAAVIAAALEEETPGRISDVLRRMPAAGKPAIKRGARAVLQVVDLANSPVRPLFSKIAS